ncbi:MAG: transcriptional regulator, MerR family [Verrucomicrobiales bacterium]|nr:transcriptional regulator, MerR family [Verrucomicrobiales bacterium]
MTNRSPHAPEPAVSAPPTSTPSDLLTLPEAAELLRAPVATLRYWRHLGSGPRSFRLGRRVLYRRDDVQAWVDAQRSSGSR